VFNACANFDENCGEMRVTHGMLAACLLSSIVACLLCGLDLLFAKLTTVMFCTGCGEVGNLKRSGFLERIG
jgi:hypothetical protein